MFRLLSVAELLHHLRTVNRFSLSLVCPHWTCSKFLQNRQESPPPPSSLPPCLVPARWGPRLHQVAEIWNGVITPGTHQMYSFHTTPGKYENAIIASHFGWGRYLDTSWQGSLYQRNIYPTLLWDTPRWEAQISEVVSKVAKLLAALRRLRPICSQSTLVTIYKSLILPHLDYCSAVCTGMYR